MLVSFIVAMGRNRVIGRGNQLPWRLSGDLKRFKELTWGKPILMGRKTHESIGRVLPGRKNLILTRNRDFEVAGAEVVHSVEAAFAAVSDAAELMVIGGAELFNLLFPKMQRLYLTVVEAEPEGDAYLPAWDLSQFRVLSEERHAADGENEYAYCFKILEK